MGKKAARDFAEKEIKPIAAEFDESGDFPIETIKKMGEMGFMGIEVPEEYGGAGLDCVSYTLVEKGLSRASLALAECIRRPTNLLAACEGEQVAHFLEPVMRGEKRDCIAMTEPEAGSDLKGMKTRAVRDGGDWVINGTKHFISNAQISDFVVLFAATGEEETEKGSRKRISCFLVDLDAPIGIDQACYLDGRAGRSDFTEELAVHPRGAFPVFAAFQKRSRSNHVVYRGAQFLQRGERNFPAASGLGLDAAIHGFAVRPERIDKQRIVENDTDPL